MRKLPAVGLAILLLTLVGCSSISRGTIVAKVIEPENTTYISQCHLVGKVTICTPVPIVDDEDYRFDLQLEDETGHVYVDHDTFNSYDEGDFYDG